MKLLSSFLNDKSVRAILAKDKIVVVDVGATGGLEKRWNIVKDFIEVISFEPREGTAALSDKKGKAKFYMTKHADLSSLLEPNSEFLSNFTMFESSEVAEIKDINADTLDSYLSNRNYNCDYIKLDTQGSELFILEGGEITLRNVLAMKVEVEFKPLYKNQPLFRDVDKFLSQRGFTLIDIRKSFFKKKIALDVGDRKEQLIWGDCIYLREPKDLAGVSDNKKLKFILLSLILGSLDYAIEMSNLSPFPLKAKKLFNFPPFRGRHRLSRYLNKLAQVLRFEKEYGYLGDIELYDE